MEILTAENKGLQYVEVGLGEANKENEVIKIEACIDCGSSLSLVRLDVFEQIPNFEKFIVASEPAKIITANADCVKTHFNAVIPLWFKDSNGYEHKYEQEFTIISNTLQQMFLGRNFLLDSKRGRYIGDKELILVEPISGDKLVKIPTKTQVKQHKIQVNLLHDVDIKPGGTIKVSVQADSPLPPGTPVLIEANDDECFDAYDTLQKRNMLDIYEMYVHNPSKSTPLSICEHTILGSIDVDAENMELHNLAIETERQQDGKELVRNLYSYKGNVNLPKHAKAVKKSEMEDIDLTRFPYPVKELVRKWGRSTTEVLNNVQAEHSVDDARPRSEEERDKIALKRAISDIRELPDLTEEERQALIDQYIREGYYDIPPSVLVDNAKYICELPGDPDETPATDEELLSELKLEHLTNGQRNLVLEMFKRNMEVFSRNEFDNPPSPVLEVDMQLIESAKDKVLNQKYREIPLKDRPAVIKSLNQMYRSGLTRRCPEPSPVLSNILVAYRKSGKPRIIIDMRALNSILVKVPTIISNVSEIMFFVANAEYLTCIDLSSAFFSLEVKKSKQPLLSFIHPETKERYCLTRAAMGMANSPYYLQQCLARVTADMGLPSGMKEETEEDPKRIKDTSFIQIYVDDIFIKGLTSFRDHIIDVEKLIKRLVKARLKISPKKVVIAGENIDILGYKLKAKQWHIPKARLQGILSWPPPKTQKQLKSFIHTLAYFRFYIPQFADRKLVLQEMLKKSHQNFRWDSKAQKVFDHLKDAIKNYVPLQPVDLNKQFIAYSDSSTFCSSYILYQHSDEKDPETGEPYMNVISCSSRSYSIAERRYSVFLLECLALLCGIKSNEAIFRSLINTLIQYTDAKGMLWLEKVKVNKNMLVEFALTISNFPIEIRHCRSEDNKSDFMSRSKYGPSIPERGLTEEEANILFEWLVLPKGFTISVERLKEMMLNKGLPSLVDNRKKAKLSKKVVTNSNLLPEKRQVRKPTTPRLQEVSPFYRSQRQELVKEQPDFWEAPRDIVKNVDAEFETNNLEGIIKTSDTERYANLPDHEAVIKKIRIQTKTFNNVPRDIQQLNEWKVNGTKPDDDLLERIDREYKDMFKDTKNNTKGCSNQKKSQVANLVKAFETNEGAEKKSDTPKGCIEEKLTQPAKVPSEEKEANVTTPKEEETILSKEGEMNVLVLSQPEKRPATVESGTHMLTEIKIGGQILQDGCLKLQTFKEAQDVDKDIQEIIKNLPMTGFVMHKGVLLKTDKSGKLRLYVPQILLKPILEQTHRFTNNIHMSKTKMLVQLDRQYYRPDMKSQVEKYVQNCMICPLEKEHCAKYPKYGKKMYPEEMTARTHWSADISCGYNEVNGYNYIICFTCQLTYYTIFVPLKSRKATELVEAFDRHVCAHFNYPKRLYSDSEQGILSDEFQQYCLENGIDCETSVRDSQFSNGVSEKIQASLKANLRLFRDENGKSWLDNLTRAGISVNNRLLDCKYCPETLLFGDTNNKNKLLVNIERVQDMTGYAKQLQKNLDQLHKLHTETREKISDQKRKYLNKSRVEQRLEKDTLVFYKNFKPTQISGSALKPYYNGPFITEQEFSDKNTWLIRNVVTGKCQIAHNTHLKPFKAEEIDITIPGNNEALALINEKLRRRQGAWTRAYTRENEDVNFIECVGNRSSRVR